MIQAKKLLLVLLTSVVVAGMPMTANAGLIKINPQQIVSYDSQVRACKVFGLSDFSISSGESVAFKLNLAKNETLVLFKSDRDCSIDYNRYFLNVYVPPNTDSGKITITLKIRRSYKETSSIRTIKQVLLINKTNYYFDSYVGGICRFVCIINGKVTSYSFRSSDSLKVYLLNAKKSYNYKTNKTTLVFNLRCRRAGVTGNYISYTKNDGPRINQYFRINCRRIDNNG